MTFSLIALDIDSKTLGVACATGGPALGGFVPHLLPDVGAAITQGFSTSVMAAEKGLAWLAEGKSVEAAVTELRRQDRGEAWRQVALMNRQGRVAGWTGEQNVPVAGMHLEPGLIVAGNMLASDEVIPAMMAAFRHARNERGLTEALLAALLAAQRHGGDRRGTRSAALKVRAPGDLPLDLRIDHAQDAVTELQTLHQHIQDDTEYQAFLARLPTADNPHRH
ncbi:DUF1028 domain-containing protein [Halomonas sp. MCCC 1A11036]|uniref:DUF1028 domain-containing protein n=1 Tax=Billgrantia zhangzhouensis TaxID=2733481 RepID=A0ABS9AAB3_9GAMM|nr:DUF1028 domain-containing protein [Halomonas zhangzhouensis]MCE8018581.1 DUF1028 domain-containing protein [Halomonas zhangzhouensis]